MVSAMNESIRDVLRSSLLSEASKVKAKFEPDDPNRIRKYPITGKKADSYKDGSWVWLLGYIDKMTEYSKPTVVVKVLAWDLNGKPAHAEHQLGKTFPAKDKKQAQKSVRDAKKYAKSLIEDGKSIMSSIEALVYFGGGREVVFFGTYKPA